MTMRDHKFGANWTSYSNYIIDFERGLVTHTKVLDRTQYTRYVREKNTNVKRPDLNHRQADQYFRAYMLGEKLIQFMKTAHNVEFRKLLTQSSPMYFRDNME